MQLLLCCHAKLQMAVRKHLWLCKLPVPTYYSKWLGLQNHSVTNVVLQPVKIGLRSFTHHTDAVKHCGRSS